MTTLDPAPPQTASDQAVSDLVWSRALTLVERIGRLHAPEGAEPTVVERRITRWRSQAPFQDDRWWTERLATDGLDEAELRALLVASTAGTISGEPPSWWRDLEEACAFPLERETTAPGRDLDELAGFFAAVEPILAWKLADVRRRIAELAAAHPRPRPSPLPLSRPPHPPPRERGTRLERSCFSPSSPGEGGWEGTGEEGRGDEGLPFDPATVDRLLLQSLPDRMAGAVSRTLALELNVARLEGRLEGSTAAERFRSFVDGLTQPGGMAAVFAEYPVLGRQVLHRADAWLDAGVEFLEHLKADWPRLIETFSAGVDPGPLTDLEGGMGDRHRGREVMIATFASGLRVVYKPRAMSADRHFQELLAWLNDHGQEPSLRTITVLDGEDHGWMEFVHHAPCASRDEVHRFYRRQGSYLALLYAIQASDFHHENLIAAGEHPVLIDLESLFQARVEDMDAQHSDLVAAHAMGRSVLEVGFLPQRVWGDREREGIDLSGLGAIPGQVVPRPLPYWESAGTDSMYLGSRSEEMPEGHNRPQLDGEEIQLIDYVDDLVSGFRDTYRLLIRHRAGFLAVLDRFGEDEVRSVLRPTQTYSLLLTDSFHPDLLRDALDRDRHFDRLWVPIESRPYLARVIPFEKADLWRGDVPIFTFRPGSRDLYASDGTPVPDFFDQTGLDLVRDRVRQLGDEDLDRQLWFLRASLVVWTVDLDRARWPSYEVMPPKQPASRDRLVAQAARIGDHLASLAIRGEGEVTWIGLVTEIGRFPALLPLKLDLYSGNPGLALFFAYLGAATGEERFTTLAREALQGVRRVVHKDPSLVTCLGAYGGWGGLIYTWTLLAALWEEPDLLREAEALVDLFASQIAINIATHIATHIATDTELDLLIGSAGCLAGLLALHTLYPSERVLAAAKACGERLLTTAVPQEDGTLGWLPEGRGNRPWAGLSHGCAGIALALLRLTAATGDTRYRDAALAAMAYERTLFNPEVGNWRDARDLEDVRVAVRIGDETYMTAWCHGSTGIGMARLAGLDDLDDNYDDAEVRAEIEAALVDTLHKGFGQNHSLCHGDLGNLSLLLAAARRLDPARWQPEVDRLSASILDSMDERGWLCGVALGVETPGLMTGLAGIGLGLLRLADPDRVPDLLTVELPGRSL